MENKKSIVFMALSVLNRKPITDLETRNNYKEVVWDYMQDLESLEKINVTQQSSAYKHKEYLKKLIILHERYKNIGDEFLPDTHIDSFLETMQEMMRDYLDNKLHLEIYRLEHKHYSTLIKNVEPSASSQNYNRLAQLKQMAYPNLG